ncbi:MAG: hypothetical protein EBX52_06695 [Proteobacteria bacterium]|nr:hypothetical protein [Pseudomonadota bacterium]
MTRIHSTVLIALLALLSDTACGKSPILNHTVAGQRGDSVVDSASDKACPLALAKSGFCASLTWNSPLAARKKLSLTLKFWRKGEANPNGPYSDPAKAPYVMLWMPSMGHGSSEVTLQKKTDTHGVALTGQYEASDAYFIMGGPWDVHVQLKDGETVTDEAIDKVQI